jgi:phosphopantetheine--protein transferase-like protein
VPVPSRHPPQPYNGNLMVGIDLVFIPEFRRQLEVSAGKILQSAFRPSEITGREPEQLAGLWAAKEAVAKAAVEAPKKWTDIVITHDPSGKPHAKVGAQEFAISISHHGDYAIAIAYRIAQ